MITPIKTYTKLHYINTSTTCIVFEPCYHSKTCLKHALRPLPEPLPVHAIASTKIDDLSQMSET